MPSEIKITESSLLILIGIQNCKKKIENSPTKLTEQSVFSVTMYAIENSGTKKSVFLTISSTYLFFPSTGGFSAISCETSSEILKAFPFFSCFKFQSHQFPQNLPPLRNPYIFYVYVKSIQKSMNVYLLLFFPSVKNQHSFSYWQIRTTGSTAR